MTAPATSTAPAGPGLVDVHAHLVTEHYVEQALAAHVDGAAAAACAAHPDRFSFTALPLPDVDGALAQVRRGIDDLGAVGVAVESTAGGSYLGDPSFEPLWAELDARGAVVLIHPTSPPGWEATALGNPRPMVEFLFDTTRTVPGLLQAGTFERYRRVQVVVPHCGAALPVLADRIALFLDTVLPGLAQPPRDDLPVAVSGEQPARCSAGSGTTSPVPRCPTRPPRSPPWSVTSACSAAATSASRPRPG